MRYEQFIHNAETGLKCGSYSMCWYGRTCVWDPLLFHFLVRFHFAPSVCVGKLPPAPADWCSFCSVGPSQQPEEFPLSPFVSVF